MTDKTLPGLDAVVTPVITDILLTRQAADTEDRRYTRAQIYALLSGEHFIFPQVDEAATPTLAWGDGDSGDFEDSDDSISRSIAGVVQAVTGPDGKLFINTLTGVGAQGSNIVSATPDKLSIYAAGSATNGVSGANVEIWAGYAAGNDPAVGGDIMLFGGGAGGGPAAGGSVRLFGGEADNEPGDVILVGGVPTVLGPGGEVSMTGGAGFGASGNRAGGDATLAGGAAAGDPGFGGNVFIAGGAAAGAGGADGGDINLDVGAGSGSGVDGLINITGLFALDLLFSNAAGPSILNEAASASNPTLIPNRANPNDGVGSPGAQAVNLLANAVPAVTYLGQDGGALWTPDFATITADNTAQTQGSGELIFSSYTKVISLNDADSITMQGTFFVDTIVHLYNPDFDEDEATYAVFPAVGDDLGQGLNTSEVIPAGVGVSYRATVADSTWERMPGNSTSLLAIHANGAMITTREAMSDIPNIIPHRGNPLTGLGSDGGNGLVSITDGEEGLLIYSNVTGEALFQPHNASIGLTAFATGGQVSATQIVSSWAIVSTVASAGDSVKLMANATQGTLMEVTNNDSTNAMDLFPEVGGDLGQGLNTALSVVAGDTVTFRKVGSVWLQLTFV